MFFLRITVFIFLSCFLFSSYTIAASENMPEEMLLILESREVVGVIPFADNQSVWLGKQGEEKVKALLPFLSEKKNIKIIRTEGFFADSVDETQNMQLSMMRAKAVRDFLSINGIEDVFVTGYGAKRAGSKENLRKDRVEIAIYDKLIDIDGAAVIQSIESLVAE